MTKVEAYQQIEAKIRIGQSTLGIAYILGSCAWVQTFSTYGGPGEMTIKSRNIEAKFTVKSLQQLVSRYSDPETLNDDVVNIIRLGAKEMLKQVFEIIHDYCKGTNQIPIFHAFPWYHFSRLIRNSFSHNYRLSFQYRGGKTLPDQTLQFSDKIIELKASMDGQELDFDILPIKYIYELAEMMKNSLSNDLV